MKRYEIRCTPEQAKKALKLGAPIEILDTEVEIEDRNIGCTVVFGGFSCQPAKLEHYLYDADGNRKEWCVILEGTEETGRIVVYTPTAEEMVGWLEEQGLLISITARNTPDNPIYNYSINRCEESWTTFSTRKEAALTAIDAALDYLTNHKKAK